jgi:hypothetical protein
MHEWVACPDCNSCEWAERGFPEKGHNVSSASGSIAVINVASAEGCHVEDSSMGSAAALAAALVEELQHWTATFPDSYTDTMVCEGSIIQ